MPDYREGDHVIVEGSDGMGAVCAKISFLTPRQVELSYYMLDLKKRRLSNYLNKDKVICKARGLSQIEEDFDELKEM